ncbi:hypothetical protein QQ045_016730 [Rhodiola kirilowii]
MKSFILLPFAALSFVSLAVSAQQCGSQASGVVCANGICCSEFGYCGSTSKYCGARCQSQCGGNPPPTSGGIARLISSSLFDWMLMCHNDPRCSAKGFYLTLVSVRLGMTVQGKGRFLDFSDKLPMKPEPLPGDTAFQGRWLGALIVALIMSIHAQLANNIMVVVRSNSPSNKPSCHNVIIGQWSPSSADASAGRIPGYGVITNIINGGIECGKG